MAGPGRPRKTPLATEPLTEGETPTETPDILTLDDLSPEQQQELALKILAKYNAAAHAAAVQANEEAEIERNLEKLEKSDLEKQRNEPHTWIEMQPIGDGDTAPQYFGPNGIPYYIPKNQRVPVPQSLIEVIDKAVVDGWVPLVDEARGIKRMVHAKVKRFSISTFGPVSPQQLADYRAEQARKAQADAQAALGKEAVSDYLREEPPFVPAFMQPAQYKDVS